MASRALGVSFSLSVSFTRVMMREEVNWRGRGGVSRGGPHTHARTTRNSFMRSRWCCSP